MARLTQAPLTDFNFTTVNQTLDNNNATFPLTQPIYVDATHDTVISASTFNYTIPFNVFLTSQRVYSPCGIELHLDDCSGPASGGSYTGEPGECTVRLHLSLARTLTLLYLYRPI